MSKVLITKEYTWDMSHMLAGHKDLCRNLHGHTYKMQVKIYNKFDPLCNFQDMVMDFKDLKKLVHTEVIERFDHAFAYWKNSNDKVELEIASLLKKNNRKIVELEFRPTAEKLVVFLKEILSELFEKNGFELKEVRLWETPTSYAEIVVED